MKGFKSRKPRCCPKRFQFDSNASRALVKLFTKLLTSVQQVTRHRVKKYLISNKLACLVCVHANKKDTRPYAMHALCVIYALLGCAFIGLAGAFPDGAPADTCVKQRANQPNHGQARTQPAHTNPYEVVADSETYHPGQQISVVIYPHANQQVFRGFFIQARDANSNEWIGEWVQSDNTKTIPECSAITHSDNRDKLGAKLIWKAPQNKRGRVFFTGTVLQQYGTFWSDIVGKVQPAQ